MYYTGSSDLVGDQLWLLRTTPPYQFFTSTVNPARTLSTRALSASSTGAVQWRGSRPKDSKQALIDALSCVSDLMPADPIDKDSIFAAAIATTVCCGRG